jgi:hypothetical protein
VIVKLTFTEMSKAHPAPKSPQDEISAVLKHYLTTKEYPDPRLAKPLLQWIASLTADAIAWYDYREAELLHRADRDLREFFQGNLQSSRAQSRRHRSSPAQLSARLDRIESHYSIQRETADRDAERQRAALKRRHESERERFAKYWESSASLLKFSKPSPALLDLREVQRRMTVVMDFEGAEYMKQVADALEILEAVEAQKRAEQAMKVAAAQLSRRQERELQILETLFEQKRADIEAEKTRMKTPVERTLKFVSDPTADVDARAALRRSALVSRLGEKDAVPRTFRKQAVKRQDPQIQQLPIRPLRTDGLFPAAQAGSVVRRSAASY